MIAAQDNIASLIPQRPPFVMIDQLVNCDETCVDTKFKVTTENVLVEDGLLSEAGIVENIAQTAAAGIGHVAVQGNGQVVIGYIAAIKNLEIFEQPKVGDEIET